MAKKQAVPAPANERKERRIGKLIGRVGQDFYILDYVFDHGNGFTGAVGTTLRPVSAAMEQEYKDTAEDYLEDHWKMAVEEGFTTDSLKDYCEQVIANDGIEAILDLSYSCWHPMVCKEYNAELPEGHDEEDKAEFCECVGGGRQFCKNGCHGKTWQEFDKIYCDQATLDLIAKFEKYTIAQEVVHQKKEAEKYRRQAAAAKLPPFAKRKQPK